MPWTIASALLASAVHAQPTPPVAAPAPPTTPPPIEAEPAPPPDAPAPPTEPATAPPAVPAEPVPSVATAQTADRPAADDDLADQGIGAELGIATGGRVTPGGFRIAGHYLYQLSRTDWFDGGAAFTFGGGAAACFRDRMDQYVCDHGFADGRGVELSANVRRLFGVRPMGSIGGLRPFARAGAGIALAQFSDDGVTGAALELHGGGGVRVAVAPDVAIVVQGDVGLGVGRFGHGLGGEPVFGIALTAGAELRLR